MRHEAIEYSCLTSSAEQSSHRAKSYYSDSSLQQLAEFTMLTKECFLSLLLFRGRKKKLI